PVYDATVNWTGTYAGKNPMLKTFRRFSLASLIVPLFGGAPLAALAADAGTLNAAVAGLLEREGVIEAGSAPSARTITRSPALDTAAASSQSAAAMQPDAAQRHESVSVPG